jgi:MEMO1 family protein
MMTCIKLISCFLIAVIASVAACFLNTVQVPAAPLEMTSIARPLLACKFYTESDFIRSVQNAAPSGIDAGRIIGGIVPHHLLADSLIAPFFSALSAAKPEIVFIAGPNHKRIGRKKINTGSWDWQTPFGVLEADDDTVKRLADSCDAGEDFDLMEDEYSISGLIPYIKYYMRDAKVVPILLHGNLGIEDSKRLAGEIRNAAGNKRWIIIGSIDFSHYLPTTAADRMDEITLKAIKTRDFEALNHMGNDNLDSPPTVMTLLEIMKGEGANEMKLLGHSNSARITGIDSDSTTSYFTLLFTKH